MATQTSRVCRDATIAAIALTGRPAASGVGVFTTSLNERLNATRESLSAATEAFRSAYAGQRVLQIKRPHENLFCERSHRTKTVRLDENPIGACLERRGVNRRFRACRPHRRVQLLQARLVT